MLVKILGAADVLIGAVLILLGVGTLIPKTILIVFAMILLFKSGMGYISDVADVASWIDFIGFLIVLISLIVISSGIVSIASIIVGILILQKGIFSFI